MEIAEINVSYSTNQPKKIALNNCRQTFDFILSQWNLDIIDFQEECKVILLNRMNNVLGIYSLSKGGSSGTVVDIRIILGIALKCNASGIILAHNHPSGNLKPSEADRRITRRLKDSCDLLEITLLDHIIISRSSFFSFTEDGSL
ncbi:JAB domain-containing protein [Flavobacterium sp. KACC 22763]|uniref:JAB domain-containing protein n=1 Tax=Flavobacterium sp. KACC 22763 TaxID=3025668 RepID=UPI002365895B|nr:JAB domain-containing protein [Flavobacterium sp. KACC 22763]WDF63173.1 JAB domain-containing protein [Flavobacterium sp. KACC 22763]